jgi:ketosteroid isomerase-like protein
MTDDERAIRDLVATWMAASQAGDVATVLGLMADDAYKERAEGRARAHLAAREETIDLTSIVEAALRAAMPEAEITRPGEFEVQVAAGGPASPFA